MGVDNAFFLVIEVRLKFYNVGRGMLMLVGQ